jgi:hypothetical protein
MPVTKVVNIILKVEEILTNLICGLLGVPYVKLKKRDQVAMYARACSPRRAKAASYRGVAGREVLRGAIE